MKKPLSRTQKIRLSAVIMLVVGIVLVSIAVIAPFETDRQLAASFDAASLKAKAMLKAFQYVGVCEPGEAALVWAEGVKNRNAAMQYAVMTQALKEKYAAALETTYPNWVTGTSSPWVDSYLIERLNVGDDTTRFRVTFFTATSEGPYKNLKAVLDAAKNGDFWQIKSVEAGSELNAFTGFE